MRLYLSSAGVGNHVDRLKQMVGENMKMLYVSNAGDGGDAGERAAHIVEKKEELEGYGFEFHELDLRHFFDDPGKLAEIVAAAGLVWAGGGNTFLLRRAMHYTGLDTMIIDGVQANQFVYGGSSAGAIVATKSLRGTENGDDPYVVPRGYKEEIIWNGLGLVYPQLVPHYQSEWFADEAQAMADYFDHNGMRYETLRDGEVYVVDGEYEEKLA